MDILELIKKTRRDIEEAEEIRAKGVKELGEIYKIVEEKIDISDDISMYELYGLLAPLITYKYKEITAEEIDNIVEPKRGWENRNEIIGLYLDPDPVIRKEAAWASEKTPLGEMIFHVRKTGLVAFTYNNITYVVTNPITEKEKVMERLKETIKVKEEIKEFIHNL